MSYVSFNVSGSIFPIPDTMQIEAIKPKLTDFLHECLEKVLNAQFEKDSLALMGFEVEDDTFTAVWPSEETEAHHARVGYAGSVSVPNVVLESAASQEISDQLELEGGFSVSGISVSVSASEDTLEDISFG